MSCYALKEHNGGSKSFSYSSSFSSSCTCTGFLILIQFFGKKTRKPVQVRDEDKDDDKEED
jgi:hypothetical protein